jgi:hypothetical protein
MSALVRCNDSLAGARDKPKARGHERDSSRNRGRHIPLWRVRPLHEKRRCTGWGLELHLPATGRVSKEPQASIVRAWVCDVKLFTRDLRVGAPEFGDHSVNVAIHLHPANVS